jgi:hypothetical protein
VLLLVALLAPHLTIAGRAASPQKQTPQGVQFPMKYEEGTERVNKGTKMKVSVGRDKIICETGKSAPFSIPVAAVTEISYDIKARRRIAEAAGVALVFWPAAPMFVFMKSKKHYVNLLWQEDGIRKEAIFKVGKGEYESFLDELQHVTNKPWKNMIAERKRIQKEFKQRQDALEREKKKKMPVEFDRAVRVGEADLKPGLYQLVLLEREGTQSEIYFFAGKDVDTKNIAAGAAVEILEQTNQVAAVQVIYKDAGQPAAISEIRMPTKTLRFL